MSTNGSSSQKQHLTAADRGGCLTSWLVFIIIANVIYIFIFLANYSRFVTYGGHALWYFIVYILFDITILGGAIALFLWRRWGFYLLVGCSIMAIFLDILSGVPITRIFLFLVARFIGLALLFLLLHEDGKWTRFFR